MNFNYAQARKDGISDAQILEHLATEQGFNLGAARRDGISDRELLVHLTGQPAQAVSDEDQSSAETKRLQRQAAEARKPKTAGDKAVKAVTDFGRGVANTVTLGFADELAAKGLSAYRGTSYEAELEAQRQADEEGGAARVAGQVVGSFIPGFGAARALTLIPKMGAVGKTAITGAGTGAVYGAGESTADTLGGVAMDTAQGGALGAVGGAAAGKAIDLLGNAKRVVTTNPVSIDLDAFAATKGVDKAPQFALKPNKRIQGDDPVYGEVIGKAQESLASGSWNGVARAHTQLSEAVNAATTEPARKAYKESLDRLNNQLRERSRLTLSGKDAEVAREALDVLKVRTIKGAVPAGKDPIDITLPPAIHEQAAEMLKKGIPEKQVTEWRNKQISAHNLSQIKIPTGKELKEGVQNIIDSPNFSLFTKQEQERLKKMINASDPLLTRFARGLLPEVLTDMVSNSPRASKYLGGASKLADNWVTMLIHASLFPKTGLPQIGLRLGKGAEAFIKQRQTKGMLSEMQARPTQAPLTEADLREMANQSVTMGTGLGMMSGMIATDDQ